MLFPLLCLLEKARCEESHRTAELGGLISYFTLLHPLRVRLKSGITKARLGSPDVSWLLLACNLSEHTTGH